MTAGTGWMADPRIGRWARHSTISLGPLPDSVPTARARTRVLLAEWGVPAGPAGDVLSVLSELVANATQATRRSGLDAPVTVWLLAGGSLLAVEVWDRVQAAPAPQHPGPGQERGRGLVIVAGLSHRWGYFWRPGWKVVWALFTL